MLAFTHDWYEIIEMTRIDGVLYVGIGISAIILIVNLQMMHDECDIQI